MLAATLRGHIGNRALQHFQQGLLHALARNIAGDRDILLGFANLVDFVDVDDALLGGFHIEIGGMEQLQQQILDILTHIPCLGEGGGVADGEGHIKNLGHGTGQQRLARTRGADEQNVALFQLHIAPKWLPNQGKSLVMVVQGHGQHLLGALLPNHILVHLARDGTRAGSVRPRSFVRAASTLLLLDDGLA